MSDFRMFTIDIGQLVFRAPGLTGVVPLVAFFTEDDGSDVYVRPYRRPIWRGRWLPTTGREIVEWRVDVGLDGTMRRLRVGPLDEVLQFATVCVRAGRVDMLAVAREAGQ